MMFLKKYLHTISLATVILFTGCASSSYSKFYTPTPLSNNNGIVFLKEGEEPNLVSSNNILQDVRVMQAKRYIPIGMSAFNGQLESIEGLKTQAKKVGAVSVLYSSQYTNTQTRSGTLLLPQTNYYSGSVNAYGTNGSGYANYNGTSTSTVAMPYSRTETLYNQTAVFYAKDTKPMKFGVYTTELSRDKRIEIGKNGVLVDNIFENTPVYNSNLMIGDIITEADGKPIESYDAFSQMMQNYDTSKGFCDFKVIRNGAEQIVKIKF